MIAIIPQPLSLEEKEGFYAVSKTTGVAADAAMQAHIALFCGITGCFAETGETAVHLSYQKDFAKEEYALTISPQGIQVQAGSEAGVLYAAETLRQILHGREEKDGRWLLPCCEIHDKPRYAYRSIHLDEARHFFGEKTVKRLLDLLALYKINVFHWHLTDDQGWRIEIKKYPRLTEVGAYRKDSTVGGWNRLAFEGKPHGGFYTQEQIRDIVAYAAARNIMIVPEIDMPAHFAAAFAAYPYLACREIDCEVQWHFGGRTPALAGMRDWNRSACIGKESTFTFVFDVLEEVFDLFPAPYFHIGGDEAPKGEWTKCPHCQKRMAENHLDSVEELQGYFNNLVNEFAKAHSKRLIVWNEALAAQRLDTSIVGQYWTVEWDDNVNQYLEKGGDLIVCKHQACYFDMCYGQYPLWNTYCFEPTKRLVPARFADQILGVEGLLWTEWVSTVEKMDMQYFPRLPALAELAWSMPENKDFEDFLNRMHENEKLLDALGVNYAEDEIALPRGYQHRQKLMHRWYFQEQDWELRKNRELKQQKNK